MSGLKLKLRAGERVVINGAVVQNGPRATTLFIIERGAKVLRLRDAILPEQACTPVTRAAYVAQLAVSGDADPAEISAELVRRLNDLERALADTPLCESIRTAADHLQNGDYYRVLRTLGDLIPAERALLNHMPSSSRQLQPEGAASLP
jgi:flagellar biosynthesis repressor protein FlbT